MSDNPNIYLDKPDALSSAMTRLDLTAEVYVNGEFCGEWAVDTSGSRRIPFHLIVNGEAWLHIEEKPAKHLSPGSLIVLPTDLPHLLASSKDIPDDLVINQMDFSTTENPIQLICGFFEFKNAIDWPLLDSLSPIILLNLGETEDELLTQENGLENGRKNKPNEEVRARHLVKQLLYELEHEAPGHYLVVNQLATLLFVEIIRQQIKTHQVKDGLLSALFNPRLSKALAAIHSNPEQHWTLEKMAKKATMGRSSFSSLFTKLVGIPAMQYLTAWRMQQAKTLLQKTNQPMWKIAEQCGYESEAAFQKAFKKTLGETPGSVRKNKSLATKA